MSQGFAACSLGLRNVGVEEALSTIAGLGFTGVDLWQVSPYYHNEGHISDSMPAGDRAVVQERARSLGLDIVALASYPGGKFHLPDGEEKRADIEWARRTVDLAVEMGAPVVRILSGQGEGRAVAEAIAPALRETAQYAEARDVKVVLETHGGQATADMANFQFLFDAVRSRALGILYDPANLCHGGRDYRAILEQLPDRIYHVHLKNVGEVESKLKPCGPTQGLVDIPWVLRTLREKGYSGAIAIEYEEGGDMTQRVAGLREWLDFVNAARDEGVRGKE